MPSTPLLDQVHEPVDSRGFDRAGLVQLAADLRQETIDAVSVTGGHLGAGLGVVELGLTGALIGFGGHDAEVVAAVLLYRAITYLPPIVLGALFGLTWRRHRLADAAT